MDGEDNIRGEDDTAGEEETTEEPGRDWRTPTLIGLGIVVAILLGTIVGYVVSGGLDDGDTAAAATSTTAANTTPTDPPTTVDPGSPTTTPGATPSTVAPPGSEIPPDTSVPGEITFTATEDTYTDTTELDEVNGFEPILALENDPPELKLALVRFVITDIDDPGAITSATLKLFVVTPADQAVTVHDVDGDWNEETTTAGNAPLLGDLVATMDPGAGEGVIAEVDVTSALTGNGVLDFYLATGSDNSTEFFSLEGDVPPRLTVVLGG